MNNAPHDIAVRAAANRTYSKTKPSVEDWAKQYIADNPEIYKMFVRFTLQAYNAGWTTVGAKMIAERIRWETHVTARGDGFKINNSAVAAMARKFMAEYPLLGEIFRTRSQTQQHEES